MDASSTAFKVADWLTIGEWCDEFQQGSLWLVGKNGEPRPFSWFLHGETWMQQAADWVREQRGDNQPQQPAKEQP